LFFSLLRAGPAQKTKKPPPRWRRRGLFRNDSADYWIISSPRARAADDDRAAGASFDDEAQLHARKRIGPGKYENWKCDVKRVCVDSANSIWHQYQPSRSSSAERR
jgi:hypothetical protein